MAKKKHRNTRAEQARRKNAEDRAYREKAKTRKAFWQQNGKKIAIVTAAVILALALIWLGYSFFYGPGGSLPSWGGRLRGVEDNWVVADLSDSGAARYFKLGEMQAPEGYTLDEDMGAGSDKKTQSFYYRADDPEATITHIYVSGVPNYTAEAQLDRLIDYGYFAQTGGAKQAVIDGRDVRYAYFVFDVSTEENAEEGTVAYANLCLYIDSVKDSCVLMMLDSPRVAMEDVTSEDVLYAEAEKLLPLLTVEK